MARAFSKRHQDGATSRWRNTIRTIRRARPCLAALRAAVSLGACSRRRTSPVMTPPSTYSSLAAATRLIVLRWHPKYAVLCCARIQLLRSSKGEARSPRRKAGERSEPGQPTFPPFLEARRAGRGSRDGPKPRAVLAGPLSRYARNRCLASKSLGCSPYCCWVAPRQVAPSKR